MLPPKHWVREVKRDSSTSPSRGFLALRLERDLRERDNRIFPHDIEALGLVLESAFVAVPKRRKSKSAKGMRRSHDFLVAPALNICPQCMLAVPPHKVCDLVEECGNVQRSKPHNPVAKEKVKK
jgi:large subunit ribosomal protein L32